MTDRIRMTLTFTSAGNGHVGIEIDTDGFDPTTMDDSVGLAWVTVCTAINERLAARGIKNFDCMRPRGGKVGH